LQIDNIFAKVVVCLVKNFQPCTMNWQVEYKIELTGVEQALLSLLIIVNPYKPGRR
jgi:hypothetical protein